MSVPNPPSRPSRSSQATRDHPALLQSVRPKRLVSAAGRRRVRRWRSLRLPLRILMLLAVATALVLAKTLLIPLVLAAFIALALNPIVAGLHRLRIPRGIGAAVVILALSAIIAGSVIGLSSPATEWLHEAPRIMRDVGFKVRHMTEPLTRVSNAASKSLAGMGISTPAVAKPAPGTTGVPAFSVHDVLTAAPGIVVAVLSVVLLVFFFLSYGREVAAHFVTATPAFGYRRIALRLVRGIQEEFSRYLLTVTLINIALGLVTAAVLWALQVPDPLLWGGLVTLLNYMPYVGAITNTLLLLVVGLLNFSTPLHAIAPAACFAVLGALEGNVITPMIMGGRMRLSPLAILVWLMIWAWLWGIPGALLAVPMLTCLKVITEWTPGWQWFARMVQR